jgi:glycosyltransferase involved in cell wall biosynthesis
MRILLSAYACEPNKGSEPGVGWNWALEIEKLGHKVWVLTRRNNKESIQNYYRLNTKPENLNFIYYDLPKWLSWWKKGGRGVYLYYFLWQIGAFFSAKSAKKTIDFDLVQHITFVAVRQPSFMGLLDIPFIFGPVGGGERAPYLLRKGFGLKGWIKDWLRDVANFVVRFDPLMHLTFGSATQILTTSEQTKQLIPKIYHHKTNIQLAIGFDRSSTNNNNVKSQEDDKPFRLLYVGRFEHWKGMGIGIKAYAKLLALNSNVTLTMIGKGPDKYRWNKLSVDLGIDHKIIWIDWISQVTLDAMYKEYDLFLFPSLHDSGGMVVLEAMSHSLPVVCFNLGGPGVLVNDSCGINIDVEDLTELQAINKLQTEILFLTRNPEYLNKLSKGSILRANERSWSNTVKSVYKNIENLK